MKKGKINYDFEVVNNDKFKLVLEMRASGQLVNLVFKKMRDALIKKLKIETPDFKVNELSKVNIDSRFLKSIKVGINSTLKKIYEEVKKDKIHVIHDDVVAAHFLKKPKRSFWYIYINVEGVYNDKRTYDRSNF